MVEDTEVHKMVRESYANRVKQQDGAGGGGGGGCCAKSKPSCCSKMVPSAEIQRSAERMGYSAEDVSSVPEDSNLGLGCGAPLTQANVKAGDIVLDLGSGAGFDAFLAARIVGAEGKVIGVDMTPEMVEKARSNATKSNYTNVEFRLGKIEALPVQDNTVDVIISNCVINLSPDKPAVFRDAFRVLKPGGRIAVSDICLTKVLPEPVRKSMSAYVGCIAGASLLDDYMQAMREAGLVNVTATTKAAFAVLACDDPIVKDIFKEVEEAKIDLEETKNSVVSASVLAYKPA